MTATASRVIRVLLPNDLRLLYRDGFLLLVVLVLPVSGVIFRFLLPYLSTLLDEWVTLERYYGVVLAFFLLGQQPILIGCVIGILFVEERDEGTLLALQVTPLSLERFLAYRLSAGMLLSIVLTYVDIRLAGLVDVGTAPLLVAAAAASLTAPIVAIAYASFIANSVQAVTAIKPVQAWALLAGLLYFVATPWQWLGSLVAPLYYPMRLFWTAAEGAPEWWLLAPGTLLPVLGFTWLLARFRRTAFT